jgi:HEAT repeat protein
MRRVFAFVFLSFVAFNPSRAQDSGVTQEAWAQLDRGLKSGDFEHRRQALFALATIDGSNQDAVSRVEAALHDSDARVRQQAALALGEMKATSAIPALQAALDDHGEVAFAAAKSLTQLGDSSGRDMLIAVLAGDRKATPGMMTNAVREAQRRVKHPEGLMLMGAEDAAGTMFGPAGMAITAISDAAHLRSKGSPARAAAAAYLAKDKDPYAVTLLEWALADDSRMVRIEAAKGVGLRGNAESIPKLQPLLKDDHNAVRCMAAASLIRLASNHGPATATRQ